MNEIKKEIFDISRSLFYEKGFKKTNISEITNRAGIAVGSFYKFYSSKEELFIDVFLREDKELKKTIVKTTDFDNDIAIVIKEVIEKLLTGMKENPILEEWYRKESFNTIIKKVAGDKLEDYEDEFYTFFLDIVGKWQEKGLLRKDVDKEYILALFNSLVFIEIHKTEIGIEHFPKLLEDLIKFTEQGLR